MTRPCRSRCSSTGRVWACQALPLALKTAPSRLEAVSSGPTSRKSRRSRGVLHDLFEQVAEDPGGLVQGGAGLVDGDGEAVQGRHRQVADEQAAVGVRGGAQPPVRPRGRRRGRRRWAGRRRRRAPRAGTSAARSPTAAGGRGFRGRRTAGPGGRARCPRPGLRRPRPGPVQPFGRAQHDHRPVRALGRRRPRGRCAAMAAMRSRAWSMASAMARWTSCGSSPVTWIGSWP